MNEKRISVAEMKSHLSEYIAKSMYNHDIFIITKRNKPVAALVNLNDLDLIELGKERKGLASIINKWEKFEEANDSISNLSSFFPS
ncbi:MAG TPA: type II toxin-antitoxin system Phd/YefM family antitoxin [Spirochaetes bacterium]|nr:type II toxin-antitoxin system Phd/YefM family antitoxin [Spirochaetota bacterium]